MIPAAFDYLRPASLAEAVSAYAGAGEDAKVLAGGQSLLAVLRLRLAYPPVLVDLGRLGELRGVREEDAAVVVGAMTTHDEVANDPLLARHAPLLARAAATVGDPAVRHRGTLGGSLAHADPAGDLPAVALALDARMVIAGPAGQRTVGAAEFFQDYLTTCLASGEILVEVHLPKLGPGWTATYEKFHRTAQAWAIVGVAAAVHRDGDTITAARVGLTNMGPTPVRATAVEAALAAAPASLAAVEQAAEQATAGTAPSSDPSASAAYRAHLARVLTGRALARAAGLS